MSDRGCRGARESFSLRSAPEETPYTEADNRVTKACRWLTFKGMLVFSSLSRLLCFLLRIFIAVEIMDQDASQAKGLLDAFKERAAQRKSRPNIESLAAGKGSTVIDPSGKSKKRPREGGQHSDNHLLPRGYADTTLSLLHTDQL